MLKPINKEQSVNESERFLSQLAEDTFFSLWSFPNIYRDEGCSKINTGKEMCDLFILIGNQAVVFSDKSIQFKGEPDSSVAWNRWYKSSIFASIKQLHGCYTWLKKHPSRVFLDKHCNEPFPFSLEDIEKVHLVAIVDDLDFRDEHVGILSYDFNEQNKKNSTTPFTIGLDANNKPFTHVFNKSMFREILSELMAITDFLDYLEAKEAAIRGRTIITADCEEQILARFVKNREPACVTGTLRKSGPQYSFGHSDWSDYKREASYYKAHLSHYVAMDNLLMLLSEAIVSANVGLAKEATLESHEIAVRMLAKEPLLSRKLLAKAFEEKYLEVPTGLRSSRLVKSIYYPDVTYIFVFFPNNFAATEDYRKTRVQIGAAYALVAKRKRPELKKIVVISTQTNGEAQSSEDIAYYDYSNSLSKDEEREADRVSSIYHILTQTIESTGNIYKSTSSTGRVARLKPRYGRNDPCFCGSGKKYKKCCYS
ncbi:YecA family protein [Vibrio splendidus]|uniref:YecA family protein n=1 Tax=Vibrio splendidus TaxID=29497 RepID=A0ABV4LXL4_VIBSP|nr:SEC-C metal-binding domain-containing protein [Vibrio tasmaniensis]PML44366.1 hypothetical protein BCT76_19120 [Vibrio tasmaniensis]